MSYRIHLQKGNDIVEVYNGIPIKNFKPVNGTEKQEYPDYIVNKNEMISIIECYKNIILEDINEHIINKEQLSILSLHYMKNYFEKVSNTNQIINSDLYILQYFYLVDILKNTDWENDTLLITHG